METTLESLSYVLERIIDHTRPAFKELTNINCYDGIKIQGGKHVTLEGTPEVAVKFTGTNYVCPYDDTYCPYRLKDMAFSPQEVIGIGGITFTPGEKYVLCSREPKT